MPKVAVLLPVYNEEENLGPLVEKTARVVGEHAIDCVFVVVDDGSTDGSAGVLSRLSAEHPLVIVTHDRNRGLGETIRDGLERAVEVAGADGVVIRMDGDNTHDPVYIPRMLEALEDSHDVVIASRFQKGGDQLGVPGNRKWISRAANLFMKILFPIRGVREYSCGYRAYRASIVRRAQEIYGRNFIQLGGFGFACTLEKLVKLNLIGARITEIPFVHRYDLKLGQSKMVANITTLGYLVMTLLCYWPWGGWRRSYRHAADTCHEPSEPRPVQLTAKADC